MYLNFLLRLREMQKIPSKQAKSKITIYCDPQAFRVQEMCVRGYNTIYLIYPQTRYQP